ncbi:hypothetical protein OROHE_006197 [Orobanche hederae]
MGDLIMLSNVMAEHSLGPNGERELLCTVVGIDELKRVY